MNPRTIMLSLLLIATTILMKAQKEYIVDRVEGTVEYLDGADGAWTKAVRLAMIPTSATVKIAEGASITIYSPQKPQALKIDIAGTSKLRRLIPMAEKQLAEKRGNVISQVIDGTNGDSSTSHSGVGYRAETDETTLAALLYAAEHPTATGSFTLKLPRQATGRYGVEIGNNSSAPSYIAVIANTGEMFYPLSISDVKTMPSLAYLPAGTKITVPECSIIAPDGVDAILIAADKAFDPEMLCLLLNKSLAQSKPDQNRPQATINVSAILARTDQ